MPIIAELLGLLNTGRDEREELTIQRDRLRVEVNRLVESIAAGVPAATVAGKIREREHDITRLEARLRTAKPGLPIANGYAPRWNSALKRGKRTCVRNRRRRDTCCGD